MRRALVILLEFTRRTGHEHPNRRAVVANYASLLQAMGRSEAEILKVFEEPEGAG